MEAVPPRSARVLAALLGRERQVLERICWQLRVAQVLVDSDRLAWAGSALREADLLCDRLGALEFNRALEVAGYGDLMTTEPNLEQLAAAWPMPGRTILRRHAVRLATLVHEAGDRARALAEALTEGPGDEDPVEGLVRRGGLAVLRRVPPPSLVDFVAPRPVLH